MSRKKSVLLSIVAFIAGIAIGAGAMLGINTGAFPLVGTVGDTEPEWLQTAGSRYQKDDYTYYVGPDGLYSAEITNEDITWLYVEKYSDGGDTCSAGWFGLSNFKNMDGTPLFEYGSRFSIRFIDFSDPDAWDNYYKSLSDDIERKSALYSGIMLEVEIARPDGTLYTDFGNEIKLYVSDSFAGEDYNLVLSPDSECEATATRILTNSDVKVPAEGRYTVYFTSHPIGFYLD